MVGDLASARLLLDTAARAAGLPHDCGFGGYRDSRAGTGLVASFGTDSDTRKALADARDFLLASLSRAWPRVVAGDQDVMDDYERHMRCLSSLVLTWAELHRESA